MTIGQVIGVVVGLVIALMGLFVVGVLMAAASSGSFFGNGK
jgi:hypothetical protein